MAKLRGSTVATTHSVRSLLRVWGAVLKQDRAPDSPEFRATQADLEAASWHKPDGTEDALSIDERSIPTV